MADRLAAGSASGDSAPYDDEAYLVVGSFEDPANARLAISRFGRAGLSMVQSMVDGQSRYRVIAGPYGEAHLSAAKKKFSTEGVVGAWRISPCQRPAADDGCLSEQQLAQLDDSRPGAGSMQVAGIRH